MVALPERPGTFKIQAEQTSVRADDDIHQAVVLINEARGDHPLRHLDDSGFHRFNDFTLSCNDQFAEDIDSPPDGPHVFDVEGFRKSPDRFVICKYPGAGNTGGSESAQSKCFTHSAGSAEHRFQNRTPAFLAVEFYDHTLAVCGNPSEGPDLSPLRPENDSRDGPGGNCFRQALPFRVRRWEPKNVLHLIHNTSHRLIDASASGYIRT